MTKMEYAKEVAEIVGGIVQEVEKANGVILTGVIVGNGNVRPTIYIDKAFEDGISVEETATRVRELAEQNQCTIDLPDMSDYSKVKQMLRARLYNKLTKAEVFRSAKRYGFDDLIIVPYIIIQEDPNGTAGAKVSAKMLEQWGVTASEVIKKALDNSAKETEIKSMAETLAELAELTPTPEVNFPFYVISNKARAFGAISVITEKKKLKKMFPNGYIIIPSSVHECLAIPMEGNINPMINMTINDINREMVDIQEQLSNHCYEFAS